MPCLQRVAGSSIQRAGYKTDRTFADCLVTGPRRTVFQVLPVALFFRAGTSSAAPTPEGPKSRRRALPLAPTRLRTADRSPKWANGHHCRMHGPCHTQPSANAPQRSAMCPHGDSQCPPADTCERFAAQTRSMPNRSKAFSTGRPTTTRPNAPASRHEPVLPFLPFA